MKLSRRVFIQSTAAAGLAAAAPAAAQAAVHRTPSPSDPFVRDTTVPVPAPATSAGMVTPVFSDDFDNLGTIDVHATNRAGYRWYRELPWGGGKQGMAEVQVNDSRLVLNQKVLNGNWGLSTLSPVTGEGTTFRFGYFEARMRFDPAGGLRSEGFPSFWMLQREQFIAPYASRYAELDIFEAYKDPGTAYTGAFIHTLHDVRDPRGGASKYENWQNLNNWSDAGINAHAWHTYGCLWQPGLVVWYLDGNEIERCSYGAGRTPTEGAIETVSRNRTSPVGIFENLDAAGGGLAMILGTGPNWPVEVDWVRVWG